MKPPWPSPGFWPIPPASSPSWAPTTIARIEAISDALKVEMDRQTWFELYTAALGREVA